MKTKVSIMTPVHIGTGENRLYFEYDFQGKYYHYLTQDIFMQIPSHDLLDMSFLEDLSTLANKRSNKKLLNQRIKAHINYRNIQPTYSLKADLKLSDKKDVAEQIKTMNQPYIPGSSLKGTIFNAIFYTFLKNQFSKIKSVPIYELKSKVRSLESLLSVLYESAPSFDDKTFKSFLKVYRQCLICRDIPFDQLRLVDAKRQKVKEPFQLLAPLSYVETIDFDQATVGEYIIIDKRRATFLLEEYSQGAYVQDFIPWLSFSKIKEACQTYFHDMLEEELDINREQSFYDYLGLTSYLNQLYSDTSSTYLRIGKDTNYFYKSISYLFKKLHPTFFETHFDCFTPIKIKPGRRHPTYDTIPATRTYYDDDQNIYYPGVIKIEFLDEN